MRFPESAATRAESIPPRAGRVASNADVVEGVAGVDALPSKYLADVALWDVPPKMSSETGDPFVSAMTLASAGTLSVVPTGAGETSSFRRAADCFANRSSTALRRDGPLEELEEAVTAGSKHRAGDRSIASV